MIYAISANTPKSHLEFKAKGQFDFNFLTATEEFLTKYNASGIVLNKRKTVLINEDGFIVSIINDVIIDEHTQQIINAFGA
ncbi:hypothetical protein IPH67_02735 [bacterium]|nr:MAG: hypothetical protein IPH67_02735 [bacterium]